jgi:Shikimate 5'-dehydrogenase C-terminal domain
LITGPFDLWPEILYNQRVFENAPDALGLVDRLDPSSSKWGAINTIGFEGRLADGSWKPLGLPEAADTSVVRGAGYNTDADALVRSLRRDLSLEPSPFDERLFHLNRAGAAYDMIYRPAVTAFLRAAQAAGRRLANGLGMLLCQGARALEIWTGRPAPEDVMRRALEQSVYGH